MAAYVQGIANNDASEGVASVAATLNGVTAGNLVAVYVTWQNVNSTCTVSDGSSLTAGTKASQGSPEVQGLWFYRLSSGSGNKTYTASFSPSVDYPTIQAMEFSVSGGFAFDDQHVGNDQSTSISSGAFNFTGSDGIALGGSVTWGADTFLLPLINGVTASVDATISPTDTARVWYRTLSSSFTGGAATATTGVLSWVCNGISFKASAAGGTAHPYSGGVGVDVELSSSVFKGKGYRGGVQADVEAASVRSKSKNYTAAVAAVVSSDSTRSKSKNYSASVEADAAITSVRALGKAYQGTVEATTQVDSTRYRGKVYADGASAVIEIAGAYLSTAAHAYEYLGSCEVISELSSDVFKGKAYLGDGRLIVEIAGESVFAYPTARSYSGSVLLSVVADSAYSASFATGAIPFRVTESVPATSWTMEGKPSDGYSLEPVPGRPAGQDGAWTMEDQDGAVTEPPVDGAYTDIGYFKEWKPWYQPYDKEGVPSTTTSKEGKPT